MASALPPLNYVRKQTRSPISKFSSVPMNKENSGDSGLIGAMILLDSWNKSPPPPKIEGSLEFSVVAMIGGCLECWPFLKCFWNLGRSRAELSRLPHGRMQRGTGWTEPGLPLPAVLMPWGCLEERVPTQVPTMPRVSVACTCVHAHVLSQGNWWARDGGQFCPQLF